MSRLKDIEEYYRSSYRHTLNEHSVVDNLNNEKLAICLKNLCIEDNKSDSKYIQSSLDNLTCHRLQIDKMVKTTDEEAIFDEMKVLASDPCIILRKSTVNKQLDVLVAPFFMEPVRSSIIENFTLSWVERLNFPRYKESKMKIMECSSLRSYPELYLVNKADFYYLHFPWLDGTYSSTRDEFKTKLDTLLETETEKIESSAVVKTQVGLLFVKVLEGKPVVEVGFKHAAIDQLRKFEIDVRKEEIDLPLVDLIKMIKST